MQFIHDHLIATIVGAILLMVLLTLRLEQQRANVEATQFYAVKKQQIALIDMIERDIENVGSGVPLGEPMILQADAEGLRFRKELADGTQAEVAYLREGPAGTVSLNGTEVPVYHVRRIVRDVNDPSRVDSGGAFESILQFQVRLHPYDPANLDAARAIEVTLESALPSGVSVPRSAWTAVFRPANLALR